MVGRTVKAGVSLPAAGEPRRCGEETLRSINQFSALKPDLPFVLRGVYRSIFSRSNSVRGSTIAVSNRRSARVVPSIGQCVLTRQGTSVMPTLSCSGISPLLDEAGVDAGSCDGHRLAGHSRLTWSGPLASPHASSVHLASGLGIGRRCSKHSANHLCMISGLKR